MRRKTLKVLLVEDDLADVSSIRRALRKARPRSTRVSDVPSLEEALEHLDTEDVDLVLVNLGLRDTPGVECVRQIRHTAPTVPIVVTAEERDERLAILALQRDAQDYLLKHQLNPTTLGRAVRYAVEPDRWQDQYRRQLSISPDGVLIVDADGRVLFVNGTAAEMLGSAPARLADLPESLRTASASAVDVVLETGRIAEVREVPTAWSGRPARLVTMRDITDRRAVEHRLNLMAAELQHANERLERLVGTDPLTQVLNRRGMEDALGVELRRADRTGDPLMALLIDCDDFKHVNDSFGHAVGDAALAALSRSVLDTVRAGDHVARVGGDEFLVLLPATTVAEGMVVAEKLRQAIKATTLPLATEGLRLSASLGVGPVPRDVVSLEEVVASLTSPLKRGKAIGKDVVAAGDRMPSEDSKARTPRHELDPDSIALHVVVQGIRRLDDGELIGHEALTRGPPGFFAMPSDLFRAAFEQNVLTTLDLRALRTSLEGFGAQWWTGWYHVNLFPSTLLNAPAERIIPLLQIEGARERICVELSEQQFLGDPTYLRPPIGKLREAGFRIAIDDVGFGRSSIEALMLLEPDVVKVDRRCIKAIATDAGNRRQLERLLAMLRAVEATVIVEGVETQEELLVLRDMGVPYGQGYLWDRPTRAPGRDAPVAPNTSSRPSRSRRPRGSSIVS
jgi:diguanylate cyclase (GGDEF)-like protein